MTFYFYSLLYGSTGHQNVALPSAAKCVEPVSRDIVSPMKKSPLGRNKVSPQS